MGSASREALASAKAELSAIGSGADLATGEQLFAAARIVAESGQLRGVLADPSADPAAKQVLVTRVFASFGEPAKRLLGAISAARWSNANELVAGIEEIGIRAVASSAPEGVHIDRELFGFGVAVDSDAELELALGSKLSGVDNKLALVQRLLEGKGSAETIAIVRQLIGQPRGRRVAELLRFAARIVADQSGYAIATVTVAKPISDEQSRRLGDALSRQNGSRVAVNLVIDPSVVGGMRVQLGDQVIDGSVAARIHDLRLRLAS